MRNDGASMQVAWAYKVVVAVDSPIEVDTVAPQAVGLAVVVRDNEYKNHFGFGIVVFPRFYFWEHNKFVRNVCI